MVAASPMANGECYEFNAALARANQRLLLLDYDGTLAPFNPDRRRAFPYPPIPHLLRSIMDSCRTRVVVISGRSAREIPQLLGLKNPPEIWGSYGLERLMPNGDYEVEAVVEKARTELDAAVGWAKQQGFEEFIEVKPGAFTLHWRGQTPQTVEAIRQAAYQALAPVACRSNLLFWEFDGGVELRVKSFDKGYVIRSILAESDPETPVAYLGDDLADEDAFRALEGRGLSVLVRQEARPTNAVRWLRPPDELIRFFYDWLSACGGRV